MSNHDFDTTTKVTLTLDSAVMSALFGDLLNSSHKFDDTTNSSISVSKIDNDWYCNLDVQGKSGSWPLDMERLLTNAFAPVIEQSRDQIYEYLKNELINRAAFNIICDNQALALEHLDIITVFEKPASDTLFVEKNDLFLVPSIVSLYKDTFEDKKATSLPIKKKQLAQWNIDEATVFNLAFSALDKRLTIEDIKKNYPRENPEVNDGKIFYTAYDMDNLYGAGYQNLYAPKLRHYISENFESGAFISFPHPSVGFIWPQGKLSVDTANILSEEELSSRTYIFNNVIHFDDEFSKSDRQMKHHLFYIPSDINAEIAMYC